MLSLFLYSPMLGVHGRALNAPPLRPLSLEAQVGTPALEPEGFVGGVGRLHLPACSEAFAPLPEEQRPWNTELKWSPLNPSVVFAEDVFVDPAQAAHETSDIRLCPQSNLIHAETMAGGPQLSVGSLIVEAIPKAASTAVRRQMIPMLSPNWTRDGLYPNTGYENWWEPCERIWPRYDDQSIRESFRVVFVRDPLDRFLAGISEIVINHMDHWQNWRARHSKPPYLKPGADQGELQAFAFEYFADVFHGYRNVHTRSQTSFLFGNPRMRPPDFIAHVEYADIAWKTVRGLVGMPKDTPPVDFPGVSNNSSESDLSWRARLLGSFDASVWRRFCNFFKQDYACLGYPPPKVCLLAWAEAA